MPRQSFSCLKLGCKEPQHPPPLLRSTPSWGPPTSTSAAWTGLETPSWPSATSSPSTPIAPRTGPPSRARSACTSPVLPHAPAVGGSGCEACSNGSSSLHVRLLHMITCCTEEARAGLCRVCWGCTEWMPGPQAYQTSSRQAAGPWHAACAQQHVLSICRPGLALAELRVSPPADPTMP